MDERTDINNGQIHYKVNKLLLNLHAERVELLIEDDWLHLRIVADAFLTLSVFERITHITTLFEKNVPEIAKELLIIVEPFLPEEYEKVVRSGQLKPLGDIQHEQTSNE